MLLVSFSLAAGLLAVPAVPATASPLLCALSQDSLEAFHEDVVAAFVELADWCQSKKLYLQRDLVYQDLLKLDPDHSKARKMLGFKRDKSGSWYQDRHRPPKDRGKPEDLAAVTVRRREACAKLAVRLDALVPSDDLEGRQREAAKLFVLDPTSAAVNRALGRVQDREGRWRDPQELAEELRKEEIAAALDEARAERVELKVFPVPPEVVKAAVPISQGFEAGRVRVVGTVPSEEMQAAVRAGAFVLEMLDRVLPAPPLEAYLPEVREDVRSERKVPSHGVFTFYMLDDRSLVPDLAAAFPGQQNMSVEDMMKTNTAFLDKRNSIGIWADERAKRLDNLVRQIVGVYFRDEFRISTKVGWAWEGFGLYLTHLAVGTRLTFYVRPSKYSNQRELNFEERLLDGNTDWLTELAIYASRGEKAKLQFTLGRDVNTMEVGDLLLANALATWLFEERPDHLGEILLRIGQGEPSVTVLEDELGMRVPEIQAAVYAFAADH